MIFGGPDIPEPPPPEKPNIPVTEPKERVGDDPSFTEGAEGARKAAGASGKAALSTQLKQAPKKKTLLGE